MKMGTKDFSLLLRRLILARLRLSPEQIFQSINLCRIQALSTTKSGLQLRTELKSIRKQSGLGYLPAVVGRTTLSLGDFFHI